MWYGLFKEFNEGKTVKATESGRCGGFAWQGLAISSNVVSHMRRGKCV